MKNIKYCFIIICLIVVSLFSFNAKLLAQSSKTIKSGSFIIDMGVLPQTVGNGLKPYGLIYDVMKNYQVPILWSINPTKVKDGVDFTIGTRNFSGGPFIIEADYITPEVASRLSYWQTQGVVGFTTTAPITVPVGTTLYKTPNWTLDKQNGSVAVPYFTNAGIPSTAYGGATSATWKNPADLLECDDLFVMPHADPQWVTHGNLLNWNQSFKGGIWLGCSAGSHLEDMFDNVTPNLSKQTNFLSEKTGNSSGAGPYYQNALIVAANHTGGVSPYTYDPTLQSDPIMQFMGIFDGAVASGAETVYIPLTPGWRSTTKVGVYDSDHKQKIDAAVNHRAAIIAWGHGFGNTSAGKVFMEASHSFNGTGPTNVAAQRVFFNFSFTAAMGVIGKDVVPVISGLPAGTILYSGQSLNLGITLPAGVDLVRDHYTVKWSSSGGGVFSPDSTTANVSFTAPSNLGIAQLKVTLFDQCLRPSFDSEPVDIRCLMNVTPVVTDICNGASSTSGAITLNISNGTGPFIWKYKRTDAVDSVSGSGTTLTGLTAGTYGFTVKGGNGGGCVATLNATITALPAFSVAAASTSNVSTFGGSDGSANITLTGGTPSFRYNWSNGASTQNLSNVPAGTYTLTVTDSKNCVASLPSAISITQPPAITITPTVTNVSCYGQNNGAINIAVSGGATPYTYLWNDGVSTQNRTGLKAGTYTLTLTDANGAVRTSGINITQPSAILDATLTTTNLSCSNSAAVGAVNLTVTGGTSAYTYAWTKTSDGTYSATTQNISSLDIGTYNVTVTDAKGCTVAKSATITKPAALTITPTNTNVTCNNSSDGGISVAISGGTASYTYSWAGPSSYTATTQNISNIAAGVYTLTVTDAKSCTANSTSTITQPTSIAITSTYSPVSCYAGSTGSITTSATGGTGSLSYAWNDGSSLTTRTGLAAGTYTLTVTDANSCKKVSAITITQPSGALSVSTNATNLLCSNSSPTGSVSLTVSGGTANYTYSWTKTGTPSYSATTQDISGLDIGTYNVTVTDAKGCIVTKSTDVTKPTAISVSASVTEPTCPANATYLYRDGAISLTVTGGTGTYSYLWSGVNSFNSTTKDITNLTAGAYSLTITDANGCTATLSKTLVNQKQNSVQPTIIKH